MQHPYSQMIEENGAGFLLAMGQAAGGEEKLTPYIHWIIGNSPIAYHNAVFAAAIPPSQVAETVAASRDCMLRHHVSGCWHVGPGMQPADIGEELLQHGFVDTGDDIGMAVDLDHLPHTVPTPAGFHVERVLHPQQLETWGEALGLGFGEGLLEGRWAAEVFARLPYTLDGPWQHFIGYLDEQPVATSTLFLHQGVAGIYFVMTLPEARGRGIGAAMTLAPLRAAQALGARSGVLGASEMGFPVYRRLGFQEYCRIKIYEWSGSTGRSNT